MNREKSIISLSVEEFVEALRQGLGLALRDEEKEDTLCSAKKHFIYGLKELANLLGCSLSTAFRIKKSGVLDSAISQHGKIIVFDADLVIELLKVQKKRNKGVRGGYKK